MLSPAIRRAISPAETAENEERRREEKRNDRFNPCGPAREVKEPVSPRTPAEEENRPGDDKVGQFVVVFGAVPHLAPFEFAEDAERDNSNGDDGDYQPDICGRFKRLALLTRCLPDQLCDHDSLNFAIDLNRPR